MSKAADKIQKKAIKAALGMLPASLIDSVPDMIIGAIIDKMNAVPHEMGEVPAINIVQKGEDCVICIIIFDAHGDFDRVVEQFPAKEFIKKLINSTENGL